MSLNLANIRSHFDQDMRRFPVGADGKVASQPTQLSRHEGQIIWQDLRADQFSAVIGEEVARIQSANTELEWKLYSHDAPIGLAEALIAAGFEQQPTETIMVRDCDLGPTPEVEGLIVNHISTLKDAEAAFDLLLNVFRSSREETPQTLLNRSVNIHPFYLGRFEGVAVSCGRLEVDSGTRFASLYGGVTHKDYRGRGFYRPVVYARCAAALRAGCAYVFSEALPTSRPILQALGFEPLCEVTGFILKPAAHNRE